MNKDSLKIIVRFLLLIPFQVFLANKLNIFGFINPQIALLFVLWFPMSDNKLSILTLSFFFGLIIDIFSNSGGINTAAMVFAAYIYTRYIKMVVRDNELDYTLFSFKNYNTPTLFTMVFGMAFFHQLIIYTLDYFSILNLFTIIFKTISNSIFTTFVILMLLTIFPAEKR